MAAERARGPAPSFDAVILAGGRSARMAGADKPALPVGGMPMLVRVARAVGSAGAASQGSGDLARALIVVGPQRPGPVADGLAAAAAGLRGGLISVCEEPQGGGPVAALRCGLAEVRAPWLVLLAADLPFLTGRWLAWLLDQAAAGGGPGAVPADRHGRAQWLASCWQTGPLRAAVAGYLGDSLTGVLQPLGPTLLQAGRAEADNGAPEPWLDCDSPAELAAARALATKGDGDS